MAVTGEKWLVDEVERLAAGGATPGELLGALPDEALEDAIYGLSVLNGAPEHTEAVNRVLRAELDSRTT